MNEKTPGPDGLEAAIRTLANRMARQLLTSRLPKGHPVRDSEDDLVEMARSRLQELMLCHPARSSHATRKHTEGRIRGAAIEWVMRSDEDDHVKEALAGALMSADLADLFPSLN